MVWELNRVIPDPPAIGLFVVAALALLIVPGPAVLYVVARSIHHGRRAGLASVLGIHVGTLVHIAAATLGLSALDRLVGGRVHGREDRRRRLPRSGSGSGRSSRDARSPRSRSAASGTCAARSRRGSS